MFRLCGIAWHDRGYQKFYLKERKNNILRTNYIRKGNAVTCFVLALFMLTSLCSAMGNSKAALGVSLSKAKTTSIAVTVKAPKKTTIKAYIYDVKISEQTSNYKSEIQRASWSGKWLHYNKEFSKKPVVKRYKGHKISYITVKNRNNG